LAKCISTQPQERIQEREVQHWTRKKKKETHERSPHTRRIQLQKKICLRGSARQTKITHHHHHKKRGANKNKVKETPLPIQMSWRQDFLKFLERKQFQLTRQEKKKKNSRGNRETGGCLWNTCFEFCCFSTPRVYFCCPEKKEKRDDGWYSERRCVVLACCVVFDCMCVCVECREQPKQKGNGTKKFACGKKDITEPSGPNGEKIFWSVSAHLHCPPRFFGSHFFCRLVSATNCHTWFSFCRLFVATITMIILFSFSQNLSLSTLVPISNFVKFFHPSGPVSQVVKISCGAVLSIFPKKR
jgi:hypothetical protein